MIDAAKCVILGIDSTKFNQSDYIRITNMDQISEIITDTQPAPKYGNLFDDHHIQLTYPKAHHHLAD